PSRAPLVGRSLGQHLLLHALRECHASRLLGGAVQLEEELRDAGAPAALAHVVPEAGCRVVGDAALLDAARATLYPSRPARLAGDACELLEEARGSRGTVAPAEVEEVLAIRLGLMMEDEALLVFLLCDRLQVARAAQRRVEEALLLRLLVEACEE